MTAEVDHRPATTTACLAVVAAVVAAAFLSGTPVALAFAAAGAAVLLVGVLAGSRRVVGYGALCALAGVTVAGLLGAGAAALLPAALAAVLAWDLGRYAISVGEQLSRDADTRRLELVHAAASVAVGAFAAAVAYAAYALAAAPGGSVTGALLLVGGGVLVVSGLR